MQQELRGDTAGITGRSVTDVANPEKKGLRQSALVRVGKSGREFQAVLARHRVESLLVTISVIRYASPSSPTVTSSKPCLRLLEDEVMASLPENMKLITPSQLSIFS